MRPVIKGGKKMKKTLALVLALIMGLVMGTAAAETQRRTCSHKLARPNSSRVPIRWRAAAASEDSNSQQGNSRQVSLQLVDGFARSAATRTPPTSAAIAARPNPLLRRGSAPSAETRTRVTSAAIAEPRVSNDCFSDLNRSRDDSRERFSYAPPSIDCEGC